jgi:serine/threonine-protein kinase
MKTVFKLSTAMAGAVLAFGLAGCSSQKEVPMLEGMDLTTAQASLVELGFQIGSIQKEFTGGKESNTVLRQVPSASTRVPKGTTIHLTVEESVTVPDMTGENFEEMRASISQLGLKMGKGIFKKSADQPDGVILSHRPAAGTRVRPGSTVQFDVASTKGNAANVLRSGVDALSEGNSDDLGNAVGDAASEAVGDAVKKGIDSLIKRLSGKDKKKSKEQNSPPPSSNDETQLPPGTSSNSTAKKPTKPKPSQPAKNADELARRANR